MNWFESDTRAVVLPVLGLARTGTSAMTHWRGTMKGRAKHGDSVRKLSFHEEVKRKEEKCMVEKRRLFC